jgi:glycerol-3-phosphate dehydrogenase
MTETNEVVVVGAGIGGAALAAVLAGNGLTPQGVARRRRFTEQMSQDPMLAAPLVTPLVGPEMVPAETFASETLVRLLALN